MGSQEHTPSNSHDQPRWDKVREARRKVAQGLDSDERALAVTADRLIAELLTERHRAAVADWEAAQVRRWREGSYE